MPNGDAGKSKGMAMYKYDFGLSFAGEDRDKAKPLADLLKAEKIRVFYDHNEEAELWGQDLYQKFQQIYGRECRFFIPFISENYLKKQWPKHELKQAQARDFKSDVEYILPLRLDDTELPGLNITTGYIDLRNHSIEEITQLCLQKLIRDEPIRQLYVFLRENNPTSINQLSIKSKCLVIRVSTAKAAHLTSILSNMSQKICQGHDHRNTLMNGGFGPSGAIPSADLEPHTIFSLTLHDDFYAAIQI